jgi:hypothetical protein
MELIGALALPKWNWRSKMKHDPILSPYYAYRVVRPWA